VDMDLEPFSRINPCGYQGMTVTRLRDLGITAGLDEVADRLLDELVSSLTQTGDRAAV